MKLSKKIMALAAGMVLTLGLSISLTSCEDLLNAAQKTLESLLADPYEEDEAEEDAAEENAGNAAPTTVSETATKSDTIGGSFTFNIAETGNSNTLHYYDTSETKVFTYKSGDTTYKNCYYQFQFTWKGAGKGNWHLYIRNNGTPIPYDDAYAAEWGDKKFIAYGTYKGDCFNASSGAVSKGDLILYTPSGKAEWAKVTITTQENDPTSFFNVAFTADGTGSGANINSARADAVEK